MEQKRCGVCFLAYCFYAAPGFLVFLNLCNLRRLRIQTEG